MKIKATNKEDFEKQYYNQINNRIPMELIIELETDDNFWKEITKVPYNNTIQSLNFMGVVLPDIKNINQFFVPNYGSIKRIKWK